MKKYLLLLLLASFSVEAQIVNIPDANFKAKLLQSSPSNIIAVNTSNQAFKIDVNNDGEIQESEAALVYSLNVSNSGILSLEGIQNFSSLRNLNCSNNSISEVNAVMSLNLSSLLVNSNNISNLDFTNNNFLSDSSFTLNCSNNPLINVNLTGLISLFSFDINNTTVEVLDFGSVNNIDFFQCNNNDSLAFLDFANINTIYEFECIDNASLQSIDFGSVNEMFNFQCKNNNSLEEINFQNVVFGGVSNVDLDDNPNLTEINVNIEDTSSLTVRNNSSLISLTLNLFGDLNSFQVYNNQNLENITINKFGEQVSSFWLISINNNINLNNFLITTIPNDKLEIGSLLLWDGQIQSLDLSNLDFNELWIATFEQLETLNIKNGNNINPNVEFTFAEVPNLRYICANEGEVDFLNNYFLDDEGLSLVNVNSYCSFNPGGEFFTVQGNSKLDLSGNGCDETDSDFPNMKFTITNGTLSGNIISNASGNYSIPVQAGTHNITPVFENPTYFNISPSNFAVAFPTETSPFTQNFCITPNGIHQDVEVVIVPLNAAIPGFDASYKIVYKNKGNTTVSGSISFTFVDNVMDFVSSTPVQSMVEPNILNWNYTDLQPFETREIEVVFNLNSPQETPALNDGEILEVIAIIDPLSGDEMPSDNTSTLNQTVVNSYDPNDKTCLEGSVVSTELIGQYVHYVIRFENTGTFFAQNVVVKDEIDLAKFDLNSLIVLSVSHQQWTRINGNKVEFIFENIQLPFPPSEERHGYIAFKIKLRNNLAVGDTFSNFASIYFDYNFPIITEPATTSIEALSNPDFEFSSFVKLYPNPTNSILTIESQSIINLKSVEIFNSLGQLIQAIPNENNQLNVDVSNLQVGTYFIKVYSDKGVGVSKFVKQ